MYYKLSNTAKRDQIERQFEVSFRYPNLYRPEIVINGLGETTIPVITNKQPASVSLAIWGILPKNYEEDWSSFQNVTNTLNINVKTLDADSWYRESFQERKCLILATGFFTYFLQNGAVFPYHIGFPDGRPFLIAGIFNELNDGFLTCSLLVGKIHRTIKRFQNLNDLMPVIIPDKLKQIWLENDIDLEGLQKIPSTSEKPILKANPISKEFFHNNITYDSMLNPMDYPDIPKN